MARAALKQMTRRGEMIVEGDVFLDIGIEPFYAR